MDALNWLIYVLLALVLGAAGQSVRIGIGMKKSSDKAATAGVESAFDINKAAIGIALGALAAMITAIVKWEAADQVLDPDFILALMAAGYAGSDILEGLIKRSGLKPASTGAS